MKKFLFGSLCAAFVLGTGTGAFAAEKAEKEIHNFGQMKAHMEEMHPGLTTKELKDMYGTCHGNGADEAPQQTNVTDVL